MIQKIKSIPVLKEAIQYDGSMSSFVEIEKFMLGKVGMASNRKLTIRTLEGDMFVSVGDWVIKGLRGEFYPCKPDIFEKSYEKIGNPE